MSEKEKNIKKPRYVIVEFTEETDENGKTSMAIISSTWIQNNNRCYWPTYFHSETQRIKAVIDHQSLKHNLCSLCPISIKFKTYNYPAAKTQLQNLEMFSNLSQSSDEMESDTQLSSTIQKRKVKRPQNEDFLEKSDLENLSEEEMQVVQNIEKYKNTVQKSQKTLEENTNIVMPTKDERSTSQHHEKSCHCCQRNQVFFKKMLQKMDYFEDALNYLKLNIEKDEEPSEFNHNQKINTMKSIDEMKNLEASLKNSDTLTNMYSTICLVGGKDIADTTRRILNILFTKQLSLQINWSGRNSKVALRNFPNILKMIMLAVRKNPISGEATQQDVETIIKTWFRNACDRGGGRQERGTNATNKTVSPPDECYN